jgi:hypothetical protein
MSLIRRLSLPERLAALAGMIAGVASIAGFVPGVYRDSHALIVQSNGQDFATLVLGLPVLAAGLVWSARGSLRGRMLVLGALGYLLYTYVVYAFVGLLGPATILHIAVVGLAAWAFLATIASPAELREADVQAAVGPSLMRRSSAGYLLAISVLFAFAWLGQIATAVSTGVRPQSLIDAGWPTSPIFTLDLAFVLPLCALTGWLLLTRRPGGYRLAAPLLVFTPILSLGVVSIGVFAAFDGQPLDPVMTTIFVVLAAIGAALAVAALMPGRSARLVSRNPMSQAHPIGRTH